MFVAGIAAAVAATALFNLGVALQAFDARRAPADLGLRFSLFARLVRRPRWVLGSVLEVAGNGPQTFAYANAPFIGVQPTLSLGLILLLALGDRLLHERVGRRGAIGVLAIIGGVVLVSWGAPEHSEAHRGAVAVIGVVAALCLLGAAPLIVRGRKLDTALLTIVASGAGFAASDVTIKLLTDDLHRNHVAAAAWGITGIAMGVVATLTSMSAFQRRPATTVVPISTAIEIFLPIVLGPLFLKENWAASTFQGLTIAAGLAAALVGAVVTARSRGVSGLVAAAQAAWSSPVAIRNRAADAVALRRLAGPDC